ncbi:MAG: hypothetical protein AAF502_15380 [Bacteroidota bacterium]
MKSIYSVFLFCALLVFACQAPVEKVKMPETKEPKTEVVDPRLSLPLDEQVRLKIQDELASDTRIDSIILDHKFGMSRTQVVRHKNKLVREKRIYPVHKTKLTRAFVYDLNLKGGKTRTFFDTYYHQDELYIMECKPVIPKGKDGPTVWNEVVELYSLKYGEPHYQLPINGMEDCKRALWIEGNLKIQVDCTEKETLISYIDLIREKEKLQDI